MSDIRNPDDAIAAFKASLAGPNTVAALRAGLIGDDIAFDTPFGTKRLIYADYTASGRALRQIEDFVMTRVLPFYANTHTEASFVGGVMSRMREGARREIARICKAEDSDVIFTGAGATGGLNRIVAGLDLAARVSAGQRVVVILGPYEHHSNILPWRESGAEVIAIPEARDGGPDMAALDQALVDASGADLIVGSFSAASNVTGILTDTHAVTRRLKHAGAISVWDYAAAAPYIAIDMGTGETAKDAIVFSPHKFPGGPGASGILILRRDIGWRARPTFPGGGTVRFVSPWGHIYSGNLVAREEAGTPNIVGDIRAALCLLVKEAVGIDHILMRDEELRQRALAAWDGLPGIDLLGQREGAHALPVFSFRVHAPDGSRIHHQLFTRMLSDHYGIQVRGGCACAGPYAHRLLDLDEDGSTALIAQLDAGEELEKPGWVRLNLTYLMSDTQVEAILAAVAELSQNACEMQRLYQGDPRTARFAPVLDAALSA
ncbi:aminotransferase class V-fold PLP-dependent enzyme [Ketogulonicigenium vulgare]|uniref:Aminotransferase, class V superfamily protein n=1 Tax=Ketogulonicigenium vulgare (strain WSH-001) TaxID=759362 RepID=F9Y7V9_KETVW|nr:aminotransferase class V-fold PLP-dependent enzyme [Ketogulonicigenium vulgare]ADO41688.1 aminotransferase, class V [Ketogulonicigenium vulgare Y25]AEM39925.1 Aminotransferase, class V superfamily protein [Ketogulonicigenium vulgare WSH-001]ALJ82226.1 aminotransferase class V [Ketogulonicigenium vulgare]ANW34879.1 aminotransferase class V [Ketogulonicigenium vulgare]AOZ53620.1 aminotransferase, class V [Ketogulonicigenium vulgare]